MPDLDDVLQHVGVRGMKWGVRRDRSRPGGADGVEESTKPKDTRGKLRKNLDSLKRERDWNKVVKEIDSLTTPQINAVAKRITLENDLKKLSKGPAGRKKDRDDYLRRDRMSDSELNRKVVRLRAKENLKRSVGEASKEQREFGQRVTKAAGELAVKYAFTRKLGPDDFMSAYNTAKDTKASDLVDSKSQVKSDIQKIALNQIKKKSGA